VAETVEATEEAGAAGGVADLTFSRGSQVPPLRKMDSYHALENSGCGLGREEWGEPIQRQRW
jgi:hypothetical protein